LTQATGITLVEETGSTNADCVEAIRAGHALAEGYWLLARRQSAGRGRQGREWFDGSGNFMGSTVVEIRDGDPPPSSLGFPAALAVAAAVDDALTDSGRVAVKWPNDVLIDGGKVAGLLLERVGRHVVIGIGVNLARAPQLPDRRTASIADFAQVPDLEAFAQCLARHFETTLAAWRADGLGLTLQSFCSRSIHTDGSAISVHDTDGSRVDGSFAGLDPEDGALRLCLADGSTRVIRAGDIT